MFSKKLEQKNRRHKKIRSRVSGTESRPRLAVSKSNKNIIAQIINDEKGETLVYVWTKGVEGKTMKEKAEMVGKKVAEEAKAKKIDTVVFDRGGFIFTGNIKTLAESARANGLKF
jgi:large subunit ribosomal protein L18